MPTVVPVCQSAFGVGGNVLTAASLLAGELQEASDGWHVLLRIRGIEHRLWLKDPPLTGEFYAAEMPFDGDFEIRAHAARRLWRALNGRAPGPALHEFSLQRRQRLTLSLRALDAKNEGNTYRTIAEALFGAKRIPERAWKTHDLRNRTIRLVQSGLALMRGGYRALLQQSRRKK